MQEYVLFANYTNNRQIKLKITNHAKTANDSSPAMLAQVFGDELYIEYVAKLNPIDKKHPVDVACLTINTKNLVSASIHNIMILNGIECYPIITRIFPQ